MKRLAPLLLALTFAVGCTNPLSGFDPSTEARQHVTFYLKRPGNEEDRAKLLATVQKFGRLPGVIEAVAGRPIDSAAASPGSSPTFDAVMLLTVADERTLLELVGRPEYRAIFDEDIRPLVERFDIAASTTDRYDLGPAVEIQDKARRDRATKAMLEPSRQGS
jgi:hypothetical protein